MGVEDKNIDSYRLHWVYSAGLLVSTYWYLEYILKVQTYAQQHTPARGWRSASHLWLAPWWNIPLFRTFGAILTQLGLADTGTWVPYMDEAKGVCVMKWDRNLANHVRGECHFSLLWWFYLWQGRDIEVWWKTIGAFTYGIEYSRLRAVQRIFVHT